MMMMMIVIIVIIQHTMIRYANSTITVCMLNCTIAILRYVIVNSVILLLISIHLATFEASTRPCAGRRRSPTNLSLSLSL